VRAVLVGAVESSEVILEAVARAPGWMIALVLTLPGAKSARHSDFVDLAPAAAAAGAQLLHVDNVNSEEAVRAILDAEADYVFVVGWSQICGARFRSACGDRVIGYHPAPLPRLRGRGVIPWTILNQEPITAGTLFWIDEGLDSGPILAQEFFHVAPDETAGSLYRKHMAVLQRIGERALTALQSECPPRQPQDERCATWAARRTPADGLIDWSCPAVEIDRLVRALAGPYPPAVTFESATAVQIHCARIAADGHRFIASPGQVISSSASEFSVKCGDGMALTVTNWSHPEQRAPKIHSVLRGDRAQATAAAASRPVGAVSCQCGRELSHV
jgi:methionyl-tRNA formyltransferase